MKLIYKSGLMCAAALLATRVFAQTPAAPQTPATDARAVTAPVAADTKPMAKTVREVGTILLLSGKTGYVDYLALSANGKTLYAGLASEDSLAVVKLKDNSIKAMISGLTNVRGVAVVPDLKLGFTSNRKGNAIGVVNLKAEKVVQTLPAPGGPDGIIYDAAANLVYAGNAEGHAATFVDPATQKVTGTLPLGGKPEFPSADPKTGLIYQELEDTSEVVTVDPKAKTVMARYPLAPGEGPSGEALDAANHRLFVGCTNGKLVVMNTDTGKVIASLPIGAGVDAVGYDPGLKQIYTANGKSGTMTIIAQKDSDTYSVVEDAPTHLKGHALAVDPKTHRIFVVYNSDIAIYEPIAK